MCVAVASSTIGTGEYAPIPPVFGPVSPSPTRFASCATSSSAQLPLPSVTANTLTSGPSSTSSTTTVDPAGPKVPSTSDARMASAASARSAATVTPLPAARPSAFTTARPPSSSTNATAASTSRNRPQRAVGTPRVAITSFANAFEPSIRAAAAFGPNTLRPASRRASPRPATSGASGPTTTRSGSSWSTRLTIPSTSSGCASGMHPATAGDPGVAGGRDHARHGGILREAPAQRVLATPAAHDQDLHGPQSTEAGRRAVRGPHVATAMVCSRAGPTPIIVIGTPPSSSRKAT